MAKATIGRLSAILSLNSAQFSKGLTKASKRSAKFGQALAGVTKKVALFGTAVTAAAVTGLAFMVRNSFKAIDKVTKLSTALNITTEDLVSFGHAAEIYGGTQEGLHKGISIFVRRIGEAKQGLGEAKRAFEEMGLDHVALSAMDTGEAFRVVADRIAAIDNTADRAAIAYQAFGRQGQSLMNLLMGGRKALNENRKDAENLGITYNTLSGKAIEGANDALNRVGKVFVGVANTISIQLAPLVEKLATGFTDLATQGDGLKGAVVDAFNFIGIAVAGTTDFIENTARALKVVTRELGRIQLFALQIAKTVFGTYIPGVIEDYKNYIAHLDKELAKKTGNNLKAFQNFMVNAAPMPGPPPPKTGPASLPGVNDPDRASPFVWDELGKKKTAEEIAKELADQMKDANGKLGAGGVSAADSVGGAPTSFLQGNIHRTAFGGGDEIQDAKGDPEQTSLLRDILLALQIGLTPTPTV